jgi:signal transduction histidine kinase
MFPSRDVQSTDSPAEAVEVRYQELEQRVHELTCALEAANQELEAFTYSVSHDLRAPLRAVNGFARILREEQGARLDDEGRDLLVQIEASGAKMNSLIESLVLLSRLSRAAMRRQPVDLRPIAEEIVSRLRLAESSRQVEIVFSGDLSVDGDPSLLRIVLDNLLSNAWKFSAKRPDARIEVGRLPGSPPTLFVRDNGAGFNMAYTRRLFGPFQRLHSAEEFPGTGIGLAMVHRIVRRHGGRIWPEAAPGQGATFFFTLAGEVEASVSTIAGAGA